MYSNLFSPQSIAELTSAMQTQFPKAIWETFYVTLLSTALAVVIGLPLGVLLVAGEKGGVLPLPKALMSVLNVIINLLRSIPFLILMIMVFPLSRLIIGTTVGTTATIVPLVVAAFPFVARLVESSLREVDPNIIEAAQSMGATPMQIICKVMIPESVPSLLQNFTIALTTILGYSAMSGIIGGGGPAFVRQERQTPQEIKQYPAKRPNRMAGALFCHIAPIDRQTAVDCESEMQ